MVMNVAKNPERIYQMVRDLHPDLHKWGLIQLIKFKLNKYRVIIRSGGIVLPYKIKKNFLYKKFSDR